MQNAAKELYFVQGTATRHIKIGVAKCAIKRLKTLQIGSPDKLVLLGTIPNLPLGEEAVYHAHFSTYRLHGEWFEESAEILSFIDRKTTEHAPCVLCRTSIDMEQESDSEKEVVISATLPVEIEGYVDDELGGAFVEFSDLDEYQKHVDPVDRLYRSFDD
jgi:hypothetical protein